MTGRSKVFHVRDVRYCCSTNIKRDLSLFCHLLFFVEKLNTCIFTVLISSTGSFYIVLLTITKYDDAVSLLIYFFKPIPYVVLFFFF
ncbi:hypothetical protein BDF21DRAFT_406898 [Thamnidium elegans]|nr:hypothetical protein BDF21DRAFT_406898 [Thamnidium elegans]